MAGVGSAASDIKASLSRRTTMKPLWGYTKGEICQDRILRGALTVKHESGSQLWLSIQGGILKPDWVKLIVSTALYVAGRPVAG